MRELSSQTAAERAKVVSATIMNWCRHPRLTVGNLSIGKISLGRWRINPDRLDLLIEGNREGLIKNLFQEKVDSLLEEYDTVLVYFEERDSIYYLNMFCDEMQYYGRRRSLDLSVEVPFLAGLSTNKKEHVPIPLSKIKLIDALEDMGFNKTKTIYILRRDGRKRK